ncbi:Pentatricopeptide repeat [Dillenia turbinata]|uniref:Pentatricopeptide repeat n=1 Tax=Dillenia turbinata TaxID=194707 RepID=A0AAN8ZBS0_9MAGN
MVTVKYTLVIESYSQKGDFEAAFKHLDEMCNKKLNPDFDTYCLILNGALEMLFEKASDDRIALADFTYGCMLMALSKKGRGNEATKIYQGTLERCINVNKDSYSAFVAALCKEDPSGKVSELWKDIVQREHYCFSRQTRSAVALHEKLEKLEGSFDVVTYNALVKGLITEGKIEEAVKVFDLMKRQKKDLRKAMKLHDEVLKMGLKPDKATYKRLIAGFS